MVNRKGSSTVDLNFSKVVKNFYYTYYALPFSEPKQNHLTKAFKMVLSICHFLTVIVNLTLFLQQNLLFLTLIYKRRWYKSNNSY
jgi:hypothetical protein